MSATARQYGPYPLPVRATVFALLPIAVCLAYASGSSAAPAPLAYLAPAVLVICPLLVLRHAFRPVTARFDRAARHLAGRRDLRHLTTRGAARAARRLGRIRTPGVYIGRSVPGNRDMWGSWEGMHLDIWGPRTGKTSTRAIPNVVAAPGMVVVTTNKRDIVDATRGVRERRGPVWVFDPQGLTGEPPSWWWNPLSFVGDSVGAGMLLASFFAGIKRSDHARSDSYFEPAAQDFFGQLLLAASVDGRPITDVYLWLTRPTDDTPARILRAGGHRLPAMAVASVLSAPHRQRAGIYGAALQMASFLVASEITQWITPGGDPGRREFRHEEFARRDDSTIYLLSQETDPMAAPIVLALTSALAYAAEGRSASDPGGRLSVPALFVLDEAANICPLKELTFFYAHFGSRGIVMMTFLQSWEQGVAVWGETGMARLWGSAHVRVYGGGVLDMGFLGDLSRLSGSFERPRTSWSFGRMTDHPATTAETAPEYILDEADLAALPRGRALVHVSGSRPFLVRTVPWWRGRHADDIQASYDTYGIPRTPTVRRRRFGRRRK